MVPKALPVRFYATALGSEPVRSFLMDLSPEDRRTVGVQVSRIEYGWPIGMPVCRLLRDGIYEVRVNISSGRIVRVLFTPFGGEAILLHAFIKKTQKTPTQDLDVALQRKKQLGTEA